MEGDREGHLQVMLAVRQRALTPHPIGTRSPPQRPAAPGRRRLQQSNKSSALLGQILSLDDHDLGVVLLIKE